jgi:hypothetical protein
MRASLRFLLAGLVLLALPARAEETVSRDYVEELERRIADLEHERDERLARDAEKRRDDLGSWTDRLRISGSANSGLYFGDDESPFADTNFQVWDARLFIDVDLGSEVSMAETAIARSLGLTFEWNLVRLGEVNNDVGELYVDFQGLFDQPWLNVQVGRFYIPFGENYLRFGKGYRDNPFITNTVGGPWWWDEGLRFYGSFADGRLGWVASVSDGETPFGEDADRDPQATLKVYAHLTPWLYVSGSVLRSGGIGSEEYPAQGAPWLGETWAHAFGDWTGIPNFHDGVPVPDGPDELDGTWMAGLDTVLTHETLGRLWLAYGWYDIDSAGASLYDRRLQYWIAEWLFEVGVLSPELRPLYLALRANGVGTYDDGEGYFLDIRQLDTFGYNVESLEAYSIALGWRLNRYVTIRTEFTHQQTSLVRGVPSDLESAAGGSDYFGLEVGAAF